VAWLEAAAAAQREQVVEEKLPRRLRLALEQSRVWRIEGRAETDGSVPGPADTRLNVAVWRVGLAGRGSNPGLVLAASIEARVTRLADHESLHRHVVRCAGDAHTLEEWARGGVALLDREVDALAAGAAYSIGLLVIHRALREQAAPPRRVHCEASPTDERGFFASSEMPRPP
jgi:hypothetical protein